MTKKIVDARENSDGNISHVRFEGNSRFTGIKTAVRMADRGEISNAHSVHASDKAPHLRTNPDRSDRNNLDWMADH